MCAKAPHDSSQHFQHTWPFPKASIIKKLIKISKIVRNNIISD